MRGRIKFVIVGAAIAAASSFVTATMLTQPEMDHDEMMAMWMEMAQPAEQHKEMAKAAGRWNQHIKSWPAPGAPPTDSEGTCRIRMILGGRFLEQDVSSRMNFGEMEIDFEGRGLYGYDRMTEKYVFTWIDNMGTMIMYGNGDVDDTGKVVTYMSELPAPGGGVTAVKMVTTIVTDDEHKVEMFADMGGGEWFKTMEITSTRAR